MKKLIKSLLEEYNEILLPSSAGNDILALAKLQRQVMKQTETMVEVDYIKTANRDMQELKRILFVYETFEQKQDYID